MSVTAQKPVPQFVQNASDTDSPEGWVNADLLSVIDYEGGAQPPKAKFIYEPHQGYVRLLQIRDFGEKPIPTFVPDSPKLKKAREGDLLLARYGGGSIDDSLGRICTGLSGAYNVALAKLIFPIDLIHGGFLKYFFKGPWFKEAISKNSRSCQLGFNRGDLRELSLPLPPLAEQKRIAEKLDELFTQVNAARDRLAKVPKILKRFRQSVLAAACSGRLTVDWRERHSDVTPAADLLGQHIRYRDARTAPDSATKVELENDVELPKTWASAALHQAAQVIDPNPSHRYPSYEKGSVPILATENFEGLDGWNLTNAKRVNASFHAQREAAHGFTEEDSCVSWLISEMNPNTGVPTLGKAYMERLPLAIPPLAEQHEIVRRVEALFKLADAIEKRVETATKRADKLTQAILAKAFRGELVPTEAELARHEGREYEPALALLERIRREREAKSKDTTVPGTRNNMKASQRKREPEEVHDARS